jgi:hypothetical protein
MFYRRIVAALILLPCLILANSPLPAIASPAIYYVSSSTGNDNNNGLYEGLAFASINKVDTLSLQPGDQVLFKCGDTWRAEQLVISWSGTPSAPIEFGSYPDGCTNKPVFSGSIPITGWVLDSGNVYRADLPVGIFPSGINQLFRNDPRLTLGRWPNIDAPNGGYSLVDAHSAGSNQITDNQLPAFDWTGAIVHVKNIRWSILDRQVTSTNGSTLVLNQGLSCLISSWGDCTGWGFFINNDLDTLDQDGEWFYDEGTRQVYLYSTQGVPTNIEGSVVQDSGDPAQHGGVMLSNGNATAYIVLNNVEIKNWFNNGISTPGGMNNDIYHDIAVSNVIVNDVDAAGVNLSSWLERPSNGRKGLRGGYNNRQTAQTFSLGSRQYLDLDQNPFIQDITLLPFASKILIDNGPAPLTLQTITPALMALADAADFTITANGNGFTANSVIRWNGVDLPTTFVDSTRLDGAVSAAQVSSLGMYPVTVWDPQPAPTGSETPPVFFQVVINLYQLSLPVTMR